MNKKIHVVIDYCPLFLFVCSLRKDLSNSLGCSCSSSPSLPDLPEEVFWSTMGASWEERCQEAEIDVGLNKCEKSSLPWHLICCFSYWTRYGEPSQLYFSSAFLCWLYVLKSLGNYWVDLFYKPSQLWIDMSRHTFNWNSLNI